jgi:hypothetical protein
VLGLVKDASRRKRGGKLGSAGDYAGGMNIMVATLLACLTASRRAAICVTNRVDRRSRKLTVKK